MRRFLIVAIVIALLLGYVGILGFAPPLPALDGKLAPYIAGLMIIAPLLAIVWVFYRFARWHRRWHRSVIAKAKLSRDAYLARHGYPP